MQTISPPDPMRWSWAAVPGRSVDAGLRELTAAVAFGGGTDEATFADLVEEVLVAGLEPVAVVARDHLRSHEFGGGGRGRRGCRGMPGGAAAVEPGAGAVDGMSSKVEGAKRSAAARRKGAVDAAFGWALHDVTPGEIAG